MTKASFFTNFICTNQSLFITIAINSRQFSFLKHCVMMKTITLFCLLALVTGIGTELTAAPVTTTSVAPRVDVGRPKGLLGLLKGKKHKRPKPAYRRAH
jgi:hypothetical protein